MKNKQQPWNHNYACYGWISGIIGNRKRILDVGCGDGTLSLLLRTADNDIVGIDSSAASVRKAWGKNSCSNVSFLHTTFEEFDAAASKFDAVIFVASIHHMDMADAVCRAKALLAKNGILIIVGLARPSNLLDWAVEAARIVPSKIISAIRQNTDSEDLHIDVSYDFPAMNEVRRIYREHLHGYTMRYGLHYRYLLTWVNK